MEWYAILAAVLPTLPLLYMIWKRDRLKPEPVWLILLSFLVGGVSAPLSMVLSNLSRDSRVEPEEVVTK